MRGQCSGARTDGVRRGRGVRSPSCAGTPGRLARRRGWSGRGVGVRPGGRRGTCGPGGGGGGRGWTGRGCVRRRDGGGGGPLRTEGREGTRPWGAGWLADHDIRPMGELALSRKNGPRLRRTFPLFHNHEPEEQQPCSNIHSLVYNIFSLDVSNPGLAFINLDAPSSPPPWPATASTRAPTPPSSTPASRTSSSRAISRISPTIQTAPTTTVS